MPPPHEKGRCRPAPRPQAPPKRLPFGHRFSSRQASLYRSGAPSAARHALGGPRRGGAHGAPPSLIPWPLPNSVAIAQPLQIPTATSATRMTSFIFSLLGSAVQLYSYGENSKNRSRAEFNLRAVAWRTQLSSRRWRSTRWADGAAVAGASGHGRVRGGCTVQHRPHGVPVTVAVLSRLL